METIINPSRNLGKKKELHIESRAFLTYLNICGFWAQFPGWSAFHNDVNFNFLDI